MSVAQSTITVTINRPVTITVPTSIGPDTDPQTADYAAFAYTTYANRPGRSEVTDAETVTAFVTAMQEHGAVVVSYSHDGKTDARVLFPTRLTLTKDHFVTAFCYCTMRGQWQSFRLDRVLSCHPLTLPPVMPGAEPEMVAA